MSAASARPASPRQPAPARASHNLPLQAVSTSGIKLSRFFHPFLFLSTLSLLLRPEITNRKNCKTGPTADVARADASPIGKSCPYIFFKRSQDPRRGSWKEQVIYFFLSVSRARQKPQAQRLIVRPTDVLPRKISTIGLSFFFFEHPLPTPPNISENYF